MLVPGDLGFRDLILVFFLFIFVGPVVGFVIRRKWRLAVARKEEIMRLVVLASEEAARAELEAAGEYGTVSISLQFQCAVCYCPTTTRCSRCKAVRYCSGKCQIIHWRQGHKEECRPPSTTSHNGEGSIYGQKAVLQGEQHEFCGNGFEIEGRCFAKPIETSPEETTMSKFSCSFEVECGKDDDEVKPIVDAKGAHIISESSSTSSLAGFSISTSTKESLVDVSRSKVPISSPPDRSVRPQPDDITPDMLETTTDVKDTELTKSPPSEFSSLLDSVNSFSCSSNLERKTSSFSAGEVQCSSAGSTGKVSTNYSDSSINASDACMPAESTASSDFWKAAIHPRNDAHDSAHSSFVEGGDGILSDSGSPLRFSFNLSGKTIPSSLSQCSKPKTVMSGDASPTSLRNEMPAYGTTPSEKIVTDLSRVRSSPALNIKGSDSVDNDSSNDSQQLKSKGIGSLSSNVSDLPSSRTGVHFVSTVKSTKVDDGVPAVPTVLPGVASSSPNVGNGLKTSMRKVVQQFKASKILVYNPLGSGIEIAGKYNCKMIFPYELFVKLYNSEKVVLHPCGLTNCGNSCYANAVLQCLAFTQPLTAYLLQGLHSKACPKKEWCFTCEFEDLILQAREGKSPLSPIGILSQIQSIGSHLGHGKEEDAHEFLRYAIDTMQSICLKEAGLNAVNPFEEETTLIGLIFGGYLRSKIKCMKCQGKSERHERMMDLTVEIDGGIGTLEEALAQFTATEILDGENKYQCGRCKSYEKAKKKLTVLEAPNVLTVVLKRFQSGKFGKLNKDVRFPLNLDLTPYMSGKSDKYPMYRLYAVVVHLDIMNAAFSGHYVCYVRNIQGKWFKIDDSTVKPVELEKVLSKGAYMLLYARLSPRAPSLIRKSMMSHDSKVKKSRSSESISLSHGGKSTTSKARPNTVPSAGPAMATRRPEDYPYWTTLDDPARFEYFDSDDGRFHPLHRISKVDSSSDISSLFSCSDEGSCSTESTRDSSSTEDLSDYIFGETSHSWNSPLRFSSDSDGSSSSPLCSRLSPLAVSKRHELDSTEISGYPTCNAGSVPEADGVWLGLPHGSSRKDDLQGKGNPSLMYSDTTKQCKKLTNRSSCSSRSCSSCSREADFKRSGWVNPFNVKSGVSLRRYSRERTAQTFY